MINSVEIIWWIEKILPFAICKIASKLGIHSWNVVIYLRKEWFASRLSRMYMSRQYFHPRLSLLCFNFIHNFQTKNCHSYHFLPKPLVYRRLYKPLTRNVLRYTELTRQSNKIAQNGKVKQRYTNVHKILREIFQPIRRQYRAWNNRGYDVERRINYRVDEIIDTPRIFGASSNREEMTRVTSRIYRDCRRGTFRFVSRPINQNESSAVVWFDANENDRAISGSVSRNHAPGK